MAATPNPSRRANRTRHLRRTLVAPPVAFAGTENAIALTENPNAGKRNAARMGTRNASELVRGERVYPRRVTA